jgi:hypothetical protein
MSRGKFGENFEFQLHQTSVFEPLLKLPDGVESSFIF